MELSFTEGYPIKTESPGFFTFETSDGSKYEIALIDSSSRLSSYCSFTSKFYDLQLTREIKGNGKRRFSFVSRIAKTLSFFIEEELRKNPEFVIFSFTDYSDEKHDGRTRLFLSWLNNYSGSFVHFDGFKFEAGERTLFAFWFCREDHPHRPELIQMFMDYYRENY